MPGCAGCGRGQAGRMQFCYKTLHVSGIFSAHHQEFSTVYSALDGSDSAWKRLSETFVKLTSAECTVENS
jgi:hypothetical protein